MSSVCLFVASGQRSCTQACRPKLWLMVKLQSWGESTARDTSYLMQLWQPRHHNLSRTTPRIGWWWGWRACTSAGWSIRCFASAWSSETVEGRHLQEDETRKRSLIQQEQGDVSRCFGSSYDNGSWTGFYHKSSYEQSLKLSPLHNKYAANLAVSFASH